MKNTILHNKPSSQQDPFHLGGHVQYEKDPKFLILPPLWQNALQVLYSYEVSEVAQS